MHVVRLSNFEGPLDLLLQLIEREELEITEVSLAAVTEQYLEHVRAMRELDLEGASEFALVAARLLDLKARSLLPARSEPEDVAEEDPAADLVRRLLEYRQFKRAADLLRQRGEREGLRFPRFPDDLVTLAAEVELEGLDLADLLRAVEGVLARTPEVETTWAIRPETLTVGECMRRLVWTLRQAGGRTTFPALFRRGSDRLEIVVTFLALLELLRRRRVRVRQSEPFADIEIMLLEGSEGAATDDEGA